MAIAVRMPELGESVDEATITLWLKNVGDEVAEYEPLLEVNTDKVDTEIPSPAGGVLLKILAEPEQTVQAGMTLAWIGAPGEALPGEDGTPEGSVPIPPPAPPARLRAETSASQTTPEPAPREPDRRPGRDPALGFISPVVARMASEHGLDLSRIKGTGLEGRITKMDVQAHLEGRGTAPEGVPLRSVEPAASAGPVSGPVPGDLIRMTRIRRTIADHMVASKRTSPHVTTVMEADMSKVAAHREAHKPVYAREGVNLTYTAYFIGAIAAALKFHPEVNSSWTDDGIRLHSEINIGMATALEGGDGLIVPVIKGADGLSLLGLARQVNDLAHRARSKNLQPDDVRGGTFTLTNHGISGSLFATPIINQPQCGILGVGALQKRAVVIGDAIAIRLMVYISLTFDHRILDGATADHFLARVKNNLESW
ncbi:MAG TPA: dihydrolipoamide acetyltransferase family protein [Anaerolineales bacterium]|nr:dihydrolipoamide acetyltransferase family protein [Anaerolineales bacterium]